MSQEYFSDAMQALKVALSLFGWFVDVILVRGTVGFRSAFVFTKTLLFLTETRWEMRFRGSGGSGIFFSVQHKVRTVAATQNQSSRQSFGGGARWVLR